MAFTQTKPTGNARNFISGTATTTDDACMLGGLMTHGSISIQLSGTWTGTVTFEATTNLTDWVALNLLPSNSTTPASTATGNGAWGDVLHGWSAVRARFSTASSGIVTITIKFLQGQF